MAGLIRGGAAAPPVRPLGTAAGTAPAPGGDPRLALLREENEALVRALAEAREDADRSAARAREEGRREGSAETASSEKRRLEALREALSSSTERWAEAVDQAEGLAVLIARTALSKLFCDQAGLAELVLATLSRQFALLRRDAIVAVRVSGEDFPDEAALAAVSDRLADRPADILRDPDLAAGQCVIDLRLGHIDLSLDGQWRRLADLLERMAEGEGE